MPNLDSSVVVKQLDEILAIVEYARSRAKYGDMSDLSVAELSEMITTLSETVQRFAPPRSAYRTRAKAIRDRHRHTQVAVLEGIVQSLKRAYANGYLQTMQQLVHSETFADFLEMADYLLSEGYKDAAAVIAGSTLEENLRALCPRHGVHITDAAGTPKKASVMNDELAKTGAYDKLVQKSVTAWLDLRNKAAHGQYASYDAKQVELFTSGIRDFLVRFPA